MHIDHIFDRHPCEIAVGKGAKVLVRRIRSVAMTDKTYWETLKAEGENIVEKIKDLIHEGNVRRVIRRLARRRDS